MRRRVALAAAAAFVCLPVAVQAQGLDLTPDTTRYLSDPNFLPYAGQIYGTTSYAHTWTNGTTKDYLGNQTSSFHVNSDDITQFLSYGITDDLEVNGEITYVPGTQRQINLANGVQESLNSSGFSDPSFGATWRLLDEGPYPVDFDLFGSFSPDWINAKAPSPMDDGTVARGGNAGTLGAALGYETEQVSLRGAFNANFFGDSNTLNLDTGDTGHTQGYTNYVLALTSQIRLDPLFSVNAGVDHTFASNQNVSNIDTGIGHVLEPGDTTALHVALNYNLVPDKAVISVNYTHAFLDNNRTLWANPLLNSTTNNRYGNVAGVQLSYLLP